MFTKTWILLLLAELTLGIRVYLHPPPVSTASLPSTLSPSQARVVVSHQLGLDTFDSITDIDRSLEKLITEGPFVGKGTWNSVLLTASEDIAQDIIPTTLKTSFSLSNPPSASSEVSLIVSSYLQRAEHVYANVYSATSLPTGTVPRLIDVFSADPSDASETFFSEMTQLVSLVESDETDVFGAFELKGLTMLAREHGRHSEQFALAAETTRALISSAMGRSKLAFVLLTYPAPSHAKRQLQPPQSPLPPPSPAPQLPIGGVSTCHASADACTNATNACSGRGNCAQASKAGKTCFVCACDVTRDSKDRPELWVGDACERKDISATFTLITGTVIVVLLIIVGSISLLYSIGDQKLPPTLTASASGHMKRD